MSPRIDARELEKYLRSKPNDPPNRQKQIELPSITASRQQDSFFDYPKYTKIDKRMPQTRYQSVTVKALRPDPDHVHVDNVNQIP